MEGGGGVEGGGGGVNSSVILHLFDAEGTADAEI